MFWNSIIPCPCLFSYSFQVKIGCEKYFTLIWNQLFFSWKGCKEPANSSYFKICPEMIWPRNMELIVGSSYDFYVILSNHYEIAAKAHLSHSWEPLRFYTWRQRQIWCLKALRNEEICQRLSTCGIFRAAGWCLAGGNSDIFYFHPYLGKIPNLTNIFQMGWNHHLDVLWSSFFSSSFGKIAWFNLDGH